ncbi:EAL domain-containing protein [Ferrovum sp.]|uniref:EAL domain-containing protein n=1 Tax=Ferrovum sp. TaxID=2609467 RepID=UPI00262ADF68|nr:EAL domain-containing protein [Ferrovum sp.]
MLKVSAKDIIDGIQKNQFRVVYQPKVRGNKIIGAEALVRWGHPATKTDIQVPFLIDAAEALGLVVQIDRFVFESASDVMRYAEKKGVSISVNISPKHFERDDFSDWMIDTVNRYAINPEFLILEMTEQSLVRNIDSVCFRMGELSQIGIRFSLDDFLTGYSSLGCLQRLPMVTELKIDKRFVAGLGSSIEDEAITSAIIRLSNTLEKTLVAEGVETAVQRRFLLAHGCDIHQGFLYAKPMEADVFVFALKNERIPGIGHAAAF